MRNYTSSFTNFLKICLVIIIIFCRGVYGGEGDQVKLSLISGSTTVGSDTTLMLGLRAQIAAGWKTYWRSPGVAGYGFNLKWEGSKNIKSVTIMWPFPHRYQTELGSVNAYKGEVIFPLQVELIDPSQPMQAVLQVDMLACDESNCLPVMGDVKLDLPPGKKTLSSEEPLLQKAMTRVPKREKWFNQQAETQALEQQTSARSQRDFQIKSVEVLGEQDTSPRLKVTAHKSQETFLRNELPDLFIELQDLFVDVPQISLSKDQKTITYVASIFSDDQHKPTYIPNLVGKPVTLTMGSESEAFEVQAIVKAETLGMIFWVTMLLMAFIGGFILNLMPCVLPVLSLKVLSVIRHGGGHQHAVRQEFLATVLGILFSFLLLAGGAILLKLSGHAVGWGLQFQEPYFIIALIGILTLFACNLFGYFEFRLPAFLSSLGGISPHRESLAGSFLEGSLVTALATPCTAPFLGTALAFALGRGSLEILSIFLAMGIGLALPFLLIAFFPQTATRLPKPGSWMVTVKYGMGFLIALTTVWLAYVLIAEIGQIGAALVAVIMLIISVVLKKSKNGSEVSKKMAWLGASLLIMASFALPPLMTQKKAIIAFEEKKIWQPFKPELITKYVKEGKTVFVTVTADWCLTCQANKYFVLKQKEVLEAFQAPNVVVMEADWTNRDPKITSYLKSFNQYGIPFYTIYGCKNPTGVFLGQLLTPSKILQNLQKETCPRSHIQERK
jgi:suppressor for copper-sensitivity B